MYIFQENAHTFPEVMKMRRQVSMGIFFVVFGLLIFSGILFMFVGMKQIRPKENLAKNEYEQIQSRQQQRAAEARLRQAEEAKEEDSGIAASKQVGPSYQFVLRIKNGDVCVYETKSGKMYMDTGFRFRELPDYIQQRIRMGMGFQSEEELFAFLESYSS